VSEQTEGSQRRLAAILSMDAAGYSRLMAADEAATVRTLTAYRDEIALLVRQHGGRVVDNPGDNVLCEFKTATSALACALETQRVLGARNAGLTPERAMVFRIGVHLGEVLAQGPRIYGDGVNIAARLEGLAEPGGVCVSQTVRDQIGTKLAVVFDDLGEQPMKNIPQPVHVYRVRSAETGSDAAAPRGKLRARWLALAAAVALLLLGGALWWRQEQPKTSAPTAPVAPDPKTAALTPPGFDDRPAIAVLPFDNLSTDPEQAFFADGLAEDLITRLSSWRAFPVIARNSSFQYRGDKIDVKRVGAELGARYVVEGSVRRAGDRIRIAAQLIDATKDEHIWAETYDRELADVFAVQDEISATIAASLVGDLNRAEGERATQNATENLEAWDLYMLARQRFEQHAPGADAAAFAEKRALLERALALDPRFATAQAELAMNDLGEAMMGGRDTRDEREKLISAALDKARLAAELDSRDAGAQVALAWAHLSRGALPEGLAAARLAIELNPSMPEAWIWFGWAQLLAGDPGACIAATERAEKLRPHWQGYDNPNENLAAAYFEAGRYEEGLEAGRRLAEALPKYFPGYTHIARNAAALGRIEEARAAIAEARRLKPDVSLEMIQQMYGVSRPEIDALRNEALRKAGL
jgi:adenylate cyclase